MTPQARGVVPPETVAAILEAKAFAEKAERLLKEITVDGARQGRIVPGVVQGDGVLYVDAPTLGPGTWSDPGGSAASG